MPFERQTTLILWNGVYFLWVVLLSKKVLASWRSQRCTPVFSKSSVVLLSAFRPLIHSELTVLVNIRCVSPLSVAGFLTNGWLHGLSWQMLHVLLRRTCVLLFMAAVFYGCLLGLLVFKCCFSLFIVFFLCLLVLLIIENGACIIVKLTVSHFNVSVSQGSVALYVCVCNY